MRVAVLASGPSQRRSAPWRTPAQGPSISTTAWRGGSPTTDQICVLHVGGRGSVRNMFYLRVSLLQQELRDQETTGGGRLAQGRLRSHPSSAPSLDPTVPRAGAVVLFAKAVGAIPAKGGCARRRRFLPHIPARPWNGPCYSEHPHRICFPSLSRCFIPVCSKALAARLADGRSSDKQGHQAT
jgi:hypothetical protein